MQWIGKVQGKVQGLRIGHDSQAAQKQCPLHPRPPAGGSTFKTNTMIVMSAMYNRRFGWSSHESLFSQVCVGVPHVSWGGEGGFPRTQGGLSACARSWKVNQGSPVYNRVHHVPLHIGPTGSAAGASEAVLRRSCTQDMARPRLLSDKTAWPAA